MPDLETLATDAVMAGPGIFRRLWHSHDLGEADVAALADLAWSRQHIAAHKPLECGDDLCILSGGLVFRQRGEDRGMRRLLSVILPGDICSYDCVTGHRTPSTLIAVTPCTVMRVSLGQVVDLFERRPNILSAILGSLSVDTAVTEELLLSIGHRTALERMAHFLCELEFRLRRMRLANNAQYLLNMTQADLGDYLALSAVHVNRTLQELRRRGLVRSSGARISLLDHAELQRLAGFSPAYLTNAL